MSRDTHTFRNPRDRDPSVRHSWLRVLLSLLVVLAMLAIGAVGCDSADPEEPIPETAPAPEPDDEAVDVDPDDPLALTERKCGDGCHDIDVVWAADYDEAGWRASIERMEGLGLRITEEETEIIVEYLVSR